MNYKLNFLDIVIISDKSKEEIENHLRGWFSMFGVTDYEFDAIWCIVSNGTKYFARFNNFKLVESVAQKAKSKIALFPIMEI